MANGIFLPFKPIKGQQFKLYFGEKFAGGTSNRLVKISKDGGAFATTTNALVMDYNNDNSPNWREAYNLTLTATEMNADAITLFVFYDGTTNFRHAITIYTQEAELSSTPTINSPVSEKITAMFQYLLGKRTVTASAETMYKDDGTTPIGSNTISDDDTTVTKGKIA